MENYKLITYEIGKNAPKLINEYLTKEYQEQNYKYLIFSQTDIIDLAKNPEELCNAYVNFMDTFNLPFTFYCYYGRFNSVLPESANYPNPRVIVKTDKGKADLITQMAYGFLILNVSMLKSQSIKLDETFPAIFYLQELAEQCFQKKLWLSNCCFLDMHESWKYFKEHKNNGYNIDIKAFQEEKDRYNKRNIQYSGIKEFLDIYKQELHKSNNDVTISVPGNTNNTAEIIDLTKLTENS